jgi:hypothetical protein
MTKMRNFDFENGSTDQRFIFPLPFATKIIKINLWNQGMACQKTVQFTI